jgi:hypothetical protein
MEFEVHMTMTTKVNILCHVTACSSVEIYLQLQGSK